MLCMFKKDDLRQPQHQHREASTQELRLQRVVPALQTWHFREVPTSLHIYVQSFEDFIVTCVFLVQYEENPGDPTSIFSKALQYRWGWAALLYKREAYRDTHGRSTERNSLSSGLGAAQVLQYKLEVYRSTRSTLLRRHGRGCWGFRHSPDNSPLCEPDAFIAKIDGSQTEAGGTAGLRLCIPSALKLL